MRNVYGQVSSRNLLKIGGYIMKKIRVGVAGYGTIGQRLADGIAMQEDM